MKRIRLFAAVVLTGLMTVGTAHAIDINGKKGLGYAQSIGGANGIAFNYGVGNLIIEAMLGVSVDSPKDNEAVGHNLAVGLGAHFAALRAAEAAWTLGARINIGNSVPAKAKGATEDPEGPTQFGVDIPTRVYWFPNKHLSLHIETGISLMFVPEEGAALRYAGSGGLATEGSFFGIFDAATGMGMTFWW